MRLPEPVPCTTSAPACRPLGRTLSLSGEALSLCRYCANTRTFRTQGK